MKPMKYVKETYEISNGNPSYIWRKLRQGNLSYMPGNPTIHVKETRHMCQGNPTYMSR